MKKWPKVYFIVLIGFGLAGCATSNRQPTSTPITQQPSSHIKALTRMIVTMAYESTSGMASSEADSDPIPTPIPAGPIETPETGTVPPDGLLVPNDPNQPTETPIPNDQIPESQPITNLVPFTHEQTGISGLRPDNWTLFDGDDSFQISSHPNAPDGFVGSFRQGAPEDAKLISTMFFNQTKSSISELGGEVLEEHIDAEGNGTLLARTISNAQGSTKPTEMMSYMRLTVSENGLLIGMAAVPAELFPQEEQFIREMVDSLSLQ